MKKKNCCVLNLLLSNIVPFRTLFLPLLHEIPNTLREHLFISVNKFSGELIKMQILLVLECTTYDHNANRPCTRSVMDTHYDTLGQDFQGAHKC